MASIETPPRLPWVAALVIASSVASAAATLLWVRAWVSAELATRPPTLVMDTAALIRGLPNEQVGAAVRDFDRVAQRLADGGVVVLDARAVIAAPPAVQFDPRAIARPAVP